MTDNDLHSLTNFEGNERTAIRERIRNHDIPPSIQSLMEEYTHTVGTRDKFLWKWLHSLFPHVTLSCVPPENRERAVNQKMVVTMFVVLLDDLAEKHEDKATFQEASKIPFESQTVDFDRDGVDTDYLAFTADVWKRLRDELEKDPRTEEFWELFVFDLKQNIDAINYSYTVNRNLVAVNLDESLIHESHNMMLFTYADIDLMCSQEFDREELSALRKIVLRTQQMARIGNWITTWQREIQEGDYSSGVVVYLLENDIITPEMLDDASQGGARVSNEPFVEIVKDHGVEEQFVNQWERNLAAVQKLGSEIRSVDIDAYADGMRTVFEYHLASRGLK